MPRIELVLPGDERAEPPPVAELYRITIERGDDIACSPEEAKTVMSMWLIESAAKRTKATRKKRLVD